MEPILSGPKAASSDLRLSVTLERSRTAETTISKVQALRGC